MCIGKCVLVVGVLSCVAAQSLNAMLYARAVSRVSSAVVSEIKGALASNKPEQVLQLLRDNGLSVNSQLTDKHETVLHFAAKLGEQQTVEQLLVKGGRANVRDRDGKTPLTYAQDNGYTDLAELLQIYTQVELSALQNTPKPQDLFEAAANNDRAGAELLLAEGADLWEKKHHGESAYNQLGFKTPFHIAFEAEHYSLATFLLKATMGINGIDEQGWTPLMLAIMADDWDMVRELIVDGADIFAGHRHNAINVAQMMESEAQLVDIFVEEKGANGVVHTYGKTWPFITLASEGGYTEVAELLLRHGAGDELANLTMVAIQNMEEGKILNLIKSETKLLDTLVEEMGSVNVRLDNFHNDTLLTLAMRKKDMELVELLLEHGADINHGDRNGNAVLHWAASSWNTDTVKFLLEHGADINRENSNGATALHWAASSGNIDVIKFLLEHGADKIHVSTALISATRTLQAGAVKLLLEHGADINIQGYYYGKTALMIAASHSVEIVELLLEQGADINIRCKHGRTALTRAKNMQQDDIAAILRAAQQQQEASVPLAQH